MKNAAAVIHVHHLELKGCEWYLRNLSTLKRASRLNRIIMDSSRMKRDCARIAVSAIGDTV